MNLQNFEYSTLNLNFTPHLNVKRKCHMKMVQHIFPHDYLIIVKRKLCLDLQMTVYFHHEWLINTLYYKNFSGSPSSVASGVQWQPNLYGLEGSPQAELSSQL